MQDTARYQYLLGLKSPWAVSRVSLDVNGQRVDVWATHASTRRGRARTARRRCRFMPTPRSGRGGIWTVAGFRRTCMRAFPAWPAVSMAWCRVLVPWAEPRSRFTRLFERLAIDVLSQCDVSGATRILRLSWDEAWGLMERAVTRGRNRKARTVVRRIGVDEKAAAKRHRGTNETPTGCCASTSLKAPI